jgi:hypothetical protein
MPLDLSGFDEKENKFEGLYRVSDTLERQRRENEKLAQEKEGRQAATSKFLTDYLDPKDHLTGTNYDPQIVTGFQDVLQKAQALAAKGANTNDILMAIGPSVSKLNQYSVTAKAINQQIKDSLGKLKAYPGYNPEALETEAKKQAFYGPDGKLKDISTVDPNQDYVTMAAQNSPELVTSGKGLDDFVNKTPMADYQRTVQTAYAGRTKNSKIEAKHPFWEDLQKDEKGNIATDATGNPVGLDVEGAPMVDDNNKPILNPETGQPFRVMNKNNFNAIMTHNPDVADYIRGQVNQHFKAAGAKQIPAEGSAQWDMMARHILGDELKTRSRSTFRTLEQQKESAQAIKIDIAQNPDQLKSIAEFNAAQRGTGDYAAYNPKTGKTVRTNPVQTIGHILNNDPDFTQGPAVQLPDGRQVVDVTESFPEGGLKTGKNEPDVVQSILYDPNKRSLIIRNRSKQKDPITKEYDISDEEIPEKKIGQYMARIAAVNGVEPDKVSSILSQVGYNGGRFTNPGDPGHMSVSLTGAKTAKIDAAVKGIQDDKFDSLKGVPTKDGVIEDVENRNILGSWLPGRDRYAITVKTPDGESKKITFKNKEEFTNYIKGGSTAPPASAPAKGSATPAVENLRKKYNY